MDQELMASADKYGIDREWLAGIVEKYGHAAVDMAVNAIRLGATPDMIVKILQKSGELGLEVYVHIMSLSSLFGAGNPLVEGEQTTIGNELVKNLIKTMLVKYKPVLLELASQQLDKIFDMLLKLLG